MFTCLKLMLYFVVFTLVVCLPCMFELCLVCNYVLLHCLYFFADLYLYIYDCGLD